MHVPPWLRSGFVFLALTLASVRAHAAPPAAVAAAVTSESPSQPVMSYKKPSAAGLYVFVMVGSDPEKSGSIWSDERKVLSREIRRVYPRSGLYRNDGSAVPVWSVDWTAPPGAVEVLPDGVHLVRTDSWGAAGEGGINFFANGRLLKSYPAADLVDDQTQLDRIESQVTGWVRTTSFDEKEHEFTLTTLDGNVFVFDVNTGEIVSASRPGRLWRGVLLLTLTVVVGMVSVSAAAQAIRHWRDRATGVAL